MRPGLHYAMSLFTLHTIRAEIVAFNTIIRGDVKIASSIWQKIVNSVGNLKKVCILLIFKPLQKVGDCLLPLTKRHYKV